jgi:hypothetical protein
MAIESAQHLKSAKSEYQVAVCDLENGETIVIKSPPLK